MTATPSFFFGLAEADVESAIAGLERRRLPAGTVVVAEGDIPGEMYVLRSGSADVQVEDQAGALRTVSRIGVGETIGEMSLLTRQPASATVTIAEDAELLVVRDPELQELGRRLPGLERNIIAILASRLVRVNRLAVGDEPGRLIVLDDHGSPSLLGYALAASIAWHTRARTIHVALADAPPEELAALATLAHAPPFRGVRSPGAELLVSRPEGEFAPDRIESTLLRLADDYDFVLVQLAGEGAAQLRGASAVRLGTTEPAPGGFAIDIGTPGTTRERPGPLARTPALSPEDERALERGLLPATTAAGGALARLARELGGLKVGVALGTGSMRGYAHLGVLRGLEGAGIPIDCLAGASIGAIVAGLYSHFGDVDQATDFLDELGARMFRPTISRRSLLSTRAMRRHIRKVIGDGLIEDLPIPVAVVATDMDRHEEVVLSRGSGTAALFASSAIPGVFPAVRIGNRVLVDGGMINPVPSSAAAGLGAGVVIAVRLVSGGGIGEEMSEEIEGPLPTAVAAIVRSIETVQTRIRAETGSVPVVQLMPDLEGVESGKLRKFKEGRRFMPAGEAAVEAAMPRLRAALPWLRDL
jgi:predicted acylesterase/phospholipase RssA/CRP-like cAMP-binding protein